MKSNLNDNSQVKTNIVLDKLFKDPNGYEVEIAERNANNLELLMKLCDGPPEHLFKNGACHIYAICLKKTESRFILQALSGSGGQDGRHVYCKLGELAIDVDGVQLESELIAKWRQKPSGNLFSCEVTEIELMQPDKDRSKPVNARGHSLHEPFVRRAIEKAEAHIAQHLTGWKNLLVLV